MCSHRHRTLSEFIPEELNPNPSERRDVPPEGCYDRHPFNNALLKLVLRSTIYGH
jgi:hypothetical protein